MTVRGVRARGIVAWWAALAVAAAVLVQAPAASADTAPAAGVPGTVSADPLPTVQVDGVVWTQAVVGNTVFVGGDFRSARPAGAAPGKQTTPRANLLAYDIRNGALIGSFRADTNGPVLAMAASPDGTRLFIGGQFTEVAGQNRFRIAAFDTATRQLLPFAPNAGTTVRALAATNSTLYVGGDFKTLGFADRPYAGAVSTSGGNVLGWRPAPNAPVTALALSPTAPLVVVGGRFTALRGSKATGIGAVSTTDGSPRSWGTANLLDVADSETAVTSLVADRTSIYATAYSWKGNGNLEGAFRANGRTGALEWVADCHGDHYSAYPWGATVYLSSHAYYCGNIGDGFLESIPAVRYHATAVTAAATTKNRHNAIYGKASFDGKPSPTLLHWYPRWEAGTYTGQDQATWHVTGNSDYVVFGGEFLAIDGKAQQGLVRFARSGLASEQAGPQSAEGLTPSLVSGEQGVVDIGWRAAADPDNRSLTYTVFRGGKAVHTISAQSTPFDPQTIAVRDSGLPPGSTQRYRVVVKDPRGNTLSGPEVAVKVAGGTVAYPDAVLQSDPEHWFRLNESNGALLDSRGSAEATGAIGLTRGVGGATADGDRATRFAGGSDGSAATKVPRPGPQAFTVEAWVNTSSGQGGRVVGFSAARGMISDGGLGDRHLYIDNAGKMRFGVDVGLQDGPKSATMLTLASPGRVNDGRWHHAVGTLDSTGMRLYIDGKLVASRGDAKRARDITGYWRIGGDRLTYWPARPASDFYAGAIDEVAVYHRALSAREVGTHFAAAKGAAAPASALRGLSPARLMDTRSSGIVPAGGVLEVPVAGRGGVPADAGAVSLNVTVTGPEGSGYVTVYPCGSSAPLASNLNYARGQTIPNAVLAGIGAGGKVCLKTPARTHLVVDVNGWFPKGSGYETLKPVRLADTRQSAIVAAGRELRVKVAGRAGVAGSAVAAALNVTVTQPRAGGYVTVYPCGTPTPLASNLNFVAGQTIPNAVVSGIGSSGEVCLKPSATTHLVVDGNGYFAPKAPFTPSVPVRAIDTRRVGGQIPAGGVLEVQIGGANGVPATASAVSMNVTVTQPRGQGWVAAYPCGGPAPKSSNLNFTTNQTIPNAVLSGVGSGGKVCFRASTSTHLIVDVNGWFPG